MSDSIYFCDAVWCGTVGERFTYAFGKMNHFNHPRDVMPFAVMLYLMMSLAQLHATQKLPDTTGYVASVGHFLHSVEWHMLKMAETEESESLFIYPPGP